jgi:hypothetical protein
MADGPARNVIEQSDEAVAKFECEGDKLVLRCLAKLADEAEEITLPRLWKKLRGMAGFYVARKSDGAMQVIKSVWLLLDGCVVLLSLDWASERELKM